MNKFATSKISWISEHATYMKVFIEFEENTAKN